MTGPTADAAMPNAANSGLLNRPPVWLIAILLAASTPSVLIMLLIAVGSTARGALLSAAVLAGFAAIVLLVIRRSGSSLPPRSFGLAGLAWGGIVALPRPRP